MTNGSGMVTPKGFLMFSGGIDKQYWAVIG